jgi:hypothetical protein
MTTNNIQHAVRLNLESTDKCTYLLFTLYTPPPTTLPYKRARLFPNQKELEATVLSVTQKSFDPAIVLKLTEDQLENLECDISLFAQSY